MRFAVIGPLEVRTDDLAPVVVAGAKERLLLAVLTAAAPHVVDTHRLVDTLWDGVPPVTARKSLQAHVVRLRSTLEPDRPKGSTGRYIVRRGAGYALAVDRETIDALHIGDLAARGRALLVSGDAEQAVRQLTAALELWRGEPYADWPDAPFADAERRRLAEVRVGAVTGLLEAQLALGRHSDVVPELEKLIAEEPLREGWWSMLMLALYRGGRQADALAAGRRARALLADELGADPGPDLRRVESAILAQDTSLDLPTQRTASGPGSASDGPRHDTPRMAIGSCPYKGLAAYQVEDAALFHGRRRLVAGLVRRLVDTPVLVVSGPSGAGKSSVVRAGLVPALAGHALPGSGDWQPVIMTPGRRPVDALANLTGESPPTAPVVLVCDQFEELWAPGADPAERAAFLDAVLGLIDDEVVVRCVAVVRGDHVGRLAEHAAFTDRLASALVLVPPPTDPELREVVTGPARSVRLSVEPELLDAVVSDVLGQAAALPLLSTALVGTWERRRGDLLTLAGYLEAGGVEGALTRSAEAAYEALGEDGRRLAQQMLVRLADSDDSGLLVRRPVPLDELDLDGDGGPVRRTIVDTFVDRRLLAVDGDRLEVAHEALLTAWPRLARWLEDDAAGRAVRRHLTPAALEWEHGGRPADELYRGARLSAALDWAAASDADVTPLERDFLDASQAQADADLRAARERERRTRRLALGLAGVLVLALLGAGLAVRYQRAAAARAVDAAAASTVADANRLAALSTTARSLDLSLLLAAQSVRLAQTPETEDGLLASLVAHRRAVRVAPVGGRPDHASVANGSVLFIALGDDIAAWTVGSAAPPRSIMDFWDGWQVVDASPTEDLLAGAGDADDQPWVRVVAEDGSQRHLAEGDAVGGLPLDVEFTADGRRLVVPVGTPTGTGDDWRWEIREVDVATGAVTPTGIRGRSPAEPSVTLAEDAETAVIWTDDPGGAVTVIDVDRDRRVRFHPDRRPATTDDFIPFADGIAQLWDDGTVTLYDRGGRSVQAIEARQAPIRMTVVSPDGTWAATAGDGSVVDVWDIDTSTGRWSQRESLVGHAGNIVIAQTDPAGRLLFTVSVDGTIIVWNMTDDAGFGDSYPGLGDRWISNRPQMIQPGRLLVAPTRPMSRSAQVHPERPNPDTVNVAATFLNPDTGRVVDQVDVGDTVDSFAFGSSVAVSPDRRKVAVTSGFATTVLDTRTREVLGKVVLPPAGGESPADAPLPAEIVWGAGWTPDGARLLLGVEGSVDKGGDGGLVVVDPSTWKPQRRIDIGEVQSIEASPDGRLLAAASEDRSQVQVLDGATLEVEHTVPLEPNDLAYDLSFSPDGRRLAFGGEFGLVYVFDTATWRRTHAPGRVHDERLGQVEWMPDGRTVITSGADETVSLFDVTRGLVRAGPLPASTDVGEGHTHLVPGIADEIIALSGERAGRRYPMEPSRWLARACAVAGRDLTRTEWSRYVPDRPYQLTCSDLS